MQTTVTAKPKTVYTYIRKEKHIQDDGSVIEVLVESKLPVGKGVGDGTEGYWERQGYIRGTLADVKAAANEEPPVETKKGKTK